MIDADDTLWENNIYFERAIANFISFLNHHEYSPEQVREVLNQVERESIVTHGYGLHSFAHSLIQTFERLAVEPITPPCTKPSMDSPIPSPAIRSKFCPACRKRYSILSERHHLILMTKGAVPEQSGKVERSGLKEYFAAIEIVSEKDVPTYRSVISKYELLPDATWMIGNSPKSDINPALAAGLNAVFVPHGEHGCWSMRKWTQRNRRGGCWWWRSFPSCGRIFRSARGAGEFEAKHKVPPLRLLRCAPVGMTEFFG